MAKELYFDFENGLKKFFKNIEEKGDIYNLEVNEFFLKNKENIRDILLRARRGEITRTKAMAELRAMEDFVFVEPGKARYVQYQSAILVKFLEIFEELCVVRPEEGEIDFNRKL